MYRDVTYVETPSYLKKPKIEDMIKCPSVYCWIPQYLTKLKGEVICMNISGGDGVLLAYDYGKLYAVIVDMKVVMYVIVIPKTCNEVDVSDFTGMPLTYMKKMINILSTNNNIIKYLRPDLENYLNKLIATLKVIVE